MKIIEKILNILYPRRCPICDKIVNQAAGKICRECRKKIPYIREPRCRKCSKPLMKNEQEYCCDCENKTHIYKKGLALVEHKGAVRKSIYRIKYNNKREYLDFYSEEIVKRYGEIIKKWNPDAIIPVPLHKKREIKRGYNQALLLAKKIGAALSIPVYDDVLLRIRQTTPQKTLTEKERKKNVESAFHIKKNKVKLNKVIVIDDIYTTGSTIDACSKCLKDAGTEIIYFLTISIGDGM